MKSPKKNVAESVRARLLNLSKERGDEFQLTLADYVIERFLYRLAGVYCEKTRKRCK